MILALVFDPSRYFLHSLIAWIIASISFLVMVQFCSALVIFFDMNPKGCNSPSISWNITAAVVWLEALVLIISLLVESKYPSNSALSNSFLSLSNACWCLSSHFHF